MYEQRWSLLCDGKLLLGGKLENDTACLPLVLFSFEETFGPTFLSWDYGQTFDKYLVCLQSGMREREKH